jgi:nicotinamidase-related amidase
LPDGSYAILLWRSDHDRNQILRGHAPEDLKGRGKAVMVAYSLFPRAVASDILTDVAPRAGDPVVTSEPDKFIGTELEKILKDKGIKTVVVVGSAAHGAVLHTAGGAAFCGFEVVVPVDGMSADSTYAEQ